MGSMVVCSSPLGATLCVTFALVLLRCNWANVLFVYTLEFRWYCVRSMRVTRFHHWSHLTHDLQRIAEYSPIPRLTRTRIHTIPAHTYIPQTSDGRTNIYTSFVRTCCTLCLRALEHRPRLNVGILVSVRNNGEPGNFVTMAHSKLDCTMTPDEICRSITDAITDSRNRPLKRSLFGFFSQWFANHLVFNNWRNIETMNQRNSNIRILTNGVSTFDITRRQELRLSHDGSGWYVVKRVVYG